jgi:HNH endonuclease
LIFWVGVTDNSWFQFLRDQKPEEVNFWQPSPRAAFTRLELGAPFLFKLKRPNNHIGGGGFFVKFSVLPLSVVWDTFGMRNGAGTQEQFEDLIRPLTPSPDARDPEVGCSVLTEPFFWHEDTWIPNPVGFATNIVQGRSYDTSEQEGASLWKSVADRLARSFDATNTTQSTREPLAMYGNPTLIKPRLGQGAFRVLVTDAYKRRCAITGEKTLPVLEAAHIVPFARKGTHQISNGLLLRSDFHKLFDLGYVTVETTKRDFRVRVSPKIREEWFNGKAYYRLDGQGLAVIPDALDQRPNREYLAWHNEKVFQS